jgi:hypothetical protein
LTFSLDSIFCAKEQFFLPCIDISPSYTEIMDNQSQQVEDKQIRSPAPADIFTFGAEQLANIIYETLRLRYIHNPDSTTKPPSEPSARA